MLSLIDITFGIELNDLKFELNFFYYGLTIVIERTEELNNCSNQYEFKVYKQC